MTIGERLDKALERWGEGRMKFQDVMKGKMEERLPDKRDLGASYPAIKRYLDDENTPSVEFLEEAAEVLGVRPEWLMLESGAMTKEQERARMESDAEIRDAIQDLDTPHPGAIMGRRWKDEEFHEVLKEALSVDRVPPLTRAIVAHHWRSVHVAAFNSPEHDGDAQDVLRLLGEAVAAPLNHLGVEAADLLDASDDLLTDYVVGVVPSIAAEWERKIHADTVDAMTTTSTDEEN